MFGPAAHAHQGRKSVMFSSELEFEVCIVIKQHSQECVSLEVIPHGL